MARSAARSWMVTACAAAGYVAFWTALVAVAVPPVPPPVPARTLPTIPSHAPGAAPAWTAAAPRVYEEVERRMRRQGARQRAQVARTILEEATRAAVDPLLVLAVIHVESGFNPGAVSPAGAAGLMQLLGATMREELARCRVPSADPSDPVANVRAGVRYLARMLAAFEDVDLALMAYNAGPGRIRGHLRAGAVPARFRAYPRSVSRALARFSAGAPPAGAAPRVLASHLQRDLPASARASGDAAALPSRPPQPALAAGAPVMAAVPTGSRRRALAGEG